MDEIEPVAWADDEDLDIVAGGDWVHGASLAPIHGLVRSPLYPQSAIDVLQAEVKRLDHLIADASWVQIAECNQIPGASDIDFGDFFEAIQKFAPGSYVALVPINAVEREQG